MRLTGSETHAPQYHDAIVHLRRRCWSNAEHWDDYQSSSKVHGHSTVKHIILTVAVVQYHRDNLMTYSDPSGGLHVAYNRQQKSNMCPWSRDLEIIEHFVYIGFPP